MQIEHKPIFTFEGTSPIERLGNQIYSDSLGCGGNGGYTVSCFFDEEGVFLGAQSTHFFSVNAEDKSSGIGRYFGRINIIHSCDSETRTVQAVQITAKHTVFCFTDKAWEEIDEMKKSNYKHLLVDNSIMVTQESSFPATEVNPDTKCKARDSFIELAGKVEKLFAEKVNTEKGIEEIGETKRTLARFAEHLKHQ